MERQMRIHEDVLRYLTIRVDEHEEGPSAMMKKSDRDDRRGGRDRDDRPPRRFANQDSDKAAEPTKGDSEKPSTPAETSEEK